MEQRKEELERIFREELEKILGANIETLPSELAPTPMDITELERWIKDE